MAKIRTERDSMGELSVPEDALWGASTQRAIENFPVSGQKPMPSFIRGQALVKRAAAEVHMGLGMLEPALAESVMKAADEVLKGTWDDHFVVDPYQAGAGTSHNMNVNEVIANRANQILEESGEESRVHPNDHVNMAQSTNDTIPTAIRLGCLMRLEELTGTVRALAKAFESKAESWKDCIKSGRTHLQDAVPITLGQEFRGFGTSLSRNADKIEAAAEGLRRLGIGGTATGSGLNAHHEYHSLMVSTLSTLSGLELEESDDLFESMQSQGDAVFFSASLRNLATDLGRIANDEVRLPAVQPGSSIMPGKVNPVMAEMTNMVCFQIIGNDVCIQQAGASGQLELNVMMPVIAQNLFHSMHLLISACSLMREKCVLGMEAQVEKAAAWLERNPILVTSLNPVIGYEKGAEVAKAALAEGRSILDVVVEKGYLSQEQAEALLQPGRMTEGGLLEKG